MKVTLGRAHINLAVELGVATLARYIKAYGHYNNTFNSHTKGRFGEIALEELFNSKGRNVTPHYKNPASDRLCDLEVVPAKFQRLEIKTWTESGWEKLGRCFAPAQVPKLVRTTDAVIWCTVPLGILTRPSDLDAFESIDVTLVGYSLPSDIETATIIWTGEPGMRQILNHQVDSKAIRPIEGIFG